MSKKLIAILSLSSLLLVGCGGKKEEVTAEKTSIEEVTNDTEQEKPKTVEESKKLMIAPHPDQTDPNELTNENVLWLAHSLLEKVEDNDYVNGISQEGIRIGLENFDIPKEKIDYAVENLGVDWNEQALKQANYYKNEEELSDTELTGRLTFEEFTQEQISYAMENAEVIEKTPEEIEAKKEEALEKVEEEIKYSEENGTSRHDLKGTLEWRNFKEEAIEYAMGNIEVDWNEQALKRAKSYQNLKLSEEGIIDRLEYEEFTDEEIDYAMENL